MKIAPLQKQELDFLRGALKDVEGTVSRDSRGGFRQLTERLEAWAAKVAVIGQVKAGKSTFMNAFLHQHDFLPSDVNPWTSVVTNIRINLESDPAYGASFEFFSEEDWNEIIEGSTKIRALTEQLLPGFDTEVLKRQTEEMRDRAQRRLGNHYRALLGTSHEYDFLSADLLKRYVCAGPGSDEGLERESLGRYAAITKVANVYMRNPQFAVPLILTDTPGVNDPFLVRDEFTCRSLDKSDVFVVVLSAHQALTNVDVALIRMLAEQDTKDVIIYINRIDELDDYNVEVPRVIKDVRERLAAAVPDMEFSVVAGSAYMADMALHPGDEVQEVRDALDNEELHEYLMEVHGHVPDDQIDRLLLGSGLDQVKMTLSTAIDNGIGCQKLAQIYEDTRAEVRGVQFATKRERKSVQMQVEQLGNDAGVTLANLESEIEDISNVQIKLDELLESANNNVDKLVTKSWSTLEKDLNSAISDFVDQHVQVIEDRVTRNSSNGGGSSNVSIDLTPLQVKMEKLISSNYQKSRSSTDVALNNCLHACDQVISEKFDNMDVGITLDDLPNDEFASTLTFSKKALSVEMVSERSWAFWRRPKVNVDKTMDALSKIATADLRPSVEKILKVYNEAQVERATAGSERIRVLMRMIDNSVAERTQRLRRDKRQFEEAMANPERIAQMNNRLQSQMEVLERRLQNLSIIESKLSRANLSQAAA